MSQAKGEVESGMMGGQRFEQSPLAPADDIGNAAVLVDLHFEMLVLEETGRPWSRTPRLQKAGREFP